MLARLVVQPNIPPIRLIIDFAAHSLSKPADSLLFR